MVPSEESHMPDGHVDEGEIHAWLDGALAPADAVAIEAHVATCAGCREAVAEARGLIAASSRILSALDAVPADVLPVSPRARRRSSFRLLAGWPIRAVAAAFVVAVGATVVLRREPRQASESDRASAGRFDSMRPASAPPAPVGPSAPSLSAPQRALSAPMPPVPTAKAARAKSHPIPPASTSGTATVNEGDRRVRESLRDQAVNATVTGAVAGRTAAGGAPAGDIGGATRGKKVTPSVVLHLNQTVSNSLAEMPAAPKAQAACDTLAHSRHADSLKALQILHDTATLPTAGAPGLAATRADSANFHDSLARIPAKTNRCP